MRCDVHVWHAGLDVELPVLSALDALLSTEERERADRFRFARDRRRFVATRALLRMILGRSLQVEPAALTILAGEQGKPYLADAPAGAAPFFNVAHSGEHALIGISAHAPIGVDIEMVRDTLEMLPIADRFFSPGERAAIRGLPQDQRQLAFFRLWTFKEAFVKGIGAGLSHPLNAFEVTAPPGVPPQLRIIGNPDAFGGWYLHDLSNAPEYAAALAIRNSDARVLVHQVSLDRPAEDWD